MPAERFVETVKKLCGKVSAARGSHGGGGDFVALKNTNWTRKKNEWFPPDGKPSRVLDKDEYDTLRRELATQVDRAGEPVLSANDLSDLDDAYVKYQEGTLAFPDEVPKGFFKLVAKSKLELADLADIDIFTSFIAEHVYEMLVGGQHENATRNLRLIHSAVLDRNRLIATTETEQRAQIQASLTYGLYISFRLGDGHKENYYLGKMEALVRDTKSSFMHRRILCHASFYGRQKSAGSKALISLLQNNDRSAPSALISTWECGTYTTAAIEQLRNGYDLDDLPEELKGMSPLDCIRRGVSSTSKQRPAERMENSLRFRVEIVSAHGRAGRVKDALEESASIRKEMDTAKIGLPHLKLRLLFAEAIAYGIAAINGESLLQYAGVDKYLEAKQLKTILNISSAYVPGEAKADSLFSNYL